MTFTTPSWVICIVYSELLLIVCFSEWFYYIESVSNSRSSVCCVNHWSYHRCSQECSWSASSQLLLALLSWWKGGIYIYISRSISFSINLVSEPIWSRSVVTGFEDLNPLIQLNIYRLITIGGTVFLRLFFVFILNINLIILWYVICYEFFQLLTFNVLSFNFYLSLAEFW